MVLEVKSTMFCYQSRSLITKLVGVGKLSVVGHTFNPSTKEAEAVVL